MRRNLGLGTLSLFAALTAAAPAVAQTYTFERSFAAATRLDVSTHRGRITITAGDDEGHIVVTGTITVKRGLNTPANSGQLAAGLSHPPRARPQRATVHLTR